MRRPKTDIERWVEVAGEQVRQQPQGRDTWMLERQIAIIAEVVKLHRETEGGARH
jgi:hypothetical protein